MLAVLGILTLAGAVGLGAYLALRGGAAPAPAAATAAAPAKEPAADAPPAAPGGPAALPADPAPEATAEDPLAAGIERLPLEPLAADPPSRAGRELTGQRSAKARGPATLKVIVTGGWGQVKIDGINRGQTPIAPVELAPGRHEVVIENPLRQTHRQVLRLRAGEERTLKVKLLPK
ncbi:MAG: PEGA domain-containing protein [Deltaproteobacteria bacterium]|nr:PEGA domain-containing protein [Deltaproteobacteria bacterium]